MLVKDVALTARQLKAGPDDGLEDGQFTAYASVFDNVDSYGDVIRKGAFAADLAKWSASGNPIPLLYGHNMSDPDFNLGHVVEAVEDDHGLLIRAQLDLENPKALQTYRTLKGRRINQMSFAYEVLTGGVIEIDGESFHELRELKLYEVSVVMIGANQETEVLAVKAAAAALTAKAGRVLSARNEDALKSVRDQLKAAATTITDVLSAVDSGDGKATPEVQEKASGDAEANATANAEEPPGANASVVAEEPKSAPSVNALATQAAHYALIGAQEGVPS